VTPGEVGNGCHAHVSFSRDGANVLTGGDRPAGLTADGESLLAGILNRLPDMQAVLAPSVQSYERLQPQHWSGSFTAWGVENREAALRFCPGSASLRSTGANAEIKPIDGTANPYLVAGLLIMSALAGLASEEELPPPVRVDPATMSEADREAGQIYRLPPDLAAAIERAERSAFLSDAFGKQLFDDVVAVRRFELEHYGDAESDVLLDLGRRYG
jgi:glutamine synthetase